MSITTRGGDHGTTRLYSGEVVDKNSPRPVALGAIDELVSILGIARLHCQKLHHQQAVLHLQRLLFVAGSEVATTPEALGRLTKRIDSEALAELDLWCRDLEAQIQMPRGFIVPAGSLAGAHLDHARTVARRCERDIVRLFRKELIANEMLLAWINRLSDLLWLLARAEEGTPTLLDEAP